LGKVVTITGVDDSVSVTNPTLVCDGMELIYLFTKADNANVRVITFNGTHFKPTATLTLTAALEQASVSFIRNGGYWWETGRQTYA
jgi:hypothetical protein